jgi:hypothetical protein
MNEINEKAHRPENKFPPFSSWKLFLVFFTVFFLSRLLLFRWSHIFGRGEGLLESFLVSLMFTVLVFFGLRRRVRPKV